MIFLHSPRSIKSNFDNIKYAKSLSKRMIKPNDMDIYFKSSEIANSLFISKNLKHV